MKKMRDNDNRAFRDAFREASRVARERTDRVLARHGVRVGQQFVLEALWREDGLTPGELARRIGVETPTVVRGVGRMEAAGLVVRRDDPQDGRLVRVYLTDRGRELEGIIPQAEDGVIEEVLSGLSRDERRQLNRLLSRILENLKGG
jgi:DNA-binding MarR family transcriptional regulator